MMQMRLLKIFIGLILLTWTSCTGLHKNTEYTMDQGETQGTYYHITYLQPEGKSLKKEIDAKLHEFDLSLSTYKPNSIISRINRNEEVETDLFFEIMYKEALFTSQKTEGAFDITVAPLVNAWGFGFENKKEDELPNVDTIMPYVGYEKVRLENHRVIKSDSSIMLDGNAIAQGYSADVIGQLLEDNDCQNYLVEIGGEIYCKGINPKGKSWQVGIDKPNDDPAAEKTEFQTIVGISNVGLATSGNYRKFYYKDGKKYAHTIDPKTGYPVQHGILSATVIATTCIRADAFATSFMVMGIEKSLKVCEGIAGMECYLIYADETGKFKTVQSSGFSKYLVE